MHAFSSFKAVRKLTRVAFWDAGPERDYSAEFERLFEAADTLTIKVCRNKVSIDTLSVPLANLKADLLVLSTSTCTSAAGCAALRQIRKSGFSFPVLVIS